MEQLIIQALKSACENNNIKFQVIVQGKELHIYANHRQDYHPNYGILEENVSRAIASLSLAEIESFWLYGRPLGQAEPNWRVFVDLSPQDEQSYQDYQEINHTEIDTHDLSNWVGTIATEVEDMGNFDLLTSGTTGDARLLLDRNSQHEVLPKEDGEFIGVSSSEVSSFDQPNDSTGDTKLLHDNGLIHGQPLQEEEINNFSANSAQLSAAIETTNVFVPKKLVQYCFIKNQTLLTEPAVPPNKQVMRLVKFFHYLSSRDQEQLATILEKYFRLGVIEPQAKIIPASQDWLTKICALDFEEQTVLALWLSRYCFDPQATLAEFEKVSRQNSAQMKIKTAHSLRQPSFPSVEKDALEPSTIEAREEIELDRGQAKFSLPPLAKKLLLPGIWILVTLILILLGIISQSFQNKITAKEIPTVCNQTIGSPEYCRLAVDLAGKKAIAQAPESLLPITEITENEATYGCGRYANLKAGIPIQKIAPETTPLISSHGEKIFDHIFVVEALQNNAKSPGQTKVGCVYTTGTAERSPKMLAADLIPLNWLEQPAQPESKANNQLSLGIFTKPVTLGISTIFAALGLAIASSLDLGLKIKHSQTIYLVALMLGVAQLISSLLPAWGLLGAIILPLATLLIVAGLVKDFQLNWQRGYPSVAVNLLLILAIEFLGSSLCLELINLSSR